MSRVLMRGVLHAHAQKVKDVPRKRALCFYRERTNSWGLQVRAPEALANYKEGKAFIVAHASLTIGDLRALRDALDEQIREEEAV